MTDDPRDGPVRLPVPPPLTPVCMRGHNPPGVFVSVRDCAGCADLRARYPLAFAPGFDANGSPAEEFDA